MKKVWVNGTFDIVHLGHIRLLEYARQQGDYLCVGVDTDARVRQLKGPDRPLNNEKARMELLSSIRYIDRVVLFGSDEELTNLIREYSPDIFVIGSEYRDKRIIGRQFAGRVLFFEKVEGYSSTGILNHKTGT